MSSCENDRAAQRAVEAEEAAFHWTELVSFDAGFWMMAMDCLLSYAIIETTIAIGTDIMGKLYNWTEEENGMFVTFPYFVCGLTLGPLGLYVDKFGRRQTLIILQGVLTLSTFFLFLYVPTCDRCYMSTVPWLFLGFGLTVYYTLMFGSVSYLVRENQHGTAYGFITCFQNIGTTVVPPIISYIHDSTLSINQGYFWTFIAFISLSLLSLFLKLALLKWDARVRGGVLESKTPQSKFIHYLQQLDDSSKENNRSDLNENLVSKSREV